MTALLDANVLIALSWTPHPDHEVARRWIAQLDEDFASCPITQGALVRFLMRSGIEQGDVSGAVRTLMARDRHVFLVEGLSYAEVDLSVLTGHRQATDAYLAALARARGARLATFDRGLAALHPDVAELIGG